MIAFKVMTWNLENLYPAGNQFGPDTQEQYNQKLDRLAQVILELDPDVLGVQEVGSEESFNDLINRLEGRYNYQRLSNFPDSRGIRVGFLSKLSIENDEDFVNFPATGLSSVPSLDSEGNLTSETRLSRGAVRIQVSPITDKPVNLIVAHLKSKLLTFPSNNGQPRFSPRNENERARVAGLALFKRTAEAVALRVKINELLEGNSQNAVILLGDLNDVPEAATNQLLHGPGGSEIGTIGFNRPDRGDDTRLFNLAALIPESRRFSRVYQGTGELIDHIFVSQELLSGNPRQLPQVDSHIDVIDGLASIGNNPNRRRGETASDHAPVTAIFNL